MGYNQTVSKSKHSTNKEYNAYMRQYRILNAKKMRAYNRKYNKEWRKNNPSVIQFPYRLQYPDKELMALIKKVRKSIEIKRQLANKKRLLILRLRTKGMTFEAIAKCVGLTRQRVHQICTKQHKTKSPLSEVE